MAFKLGETYLNGHGASVHIICVDSNIRGNNSAICPIIGEVTAKGQSYPNIVSYYDEDGRYCGQKSAEYTPHSLISNDPTSEELELISKIADYCSHQDRRSVGEKQEALLEIVRALRNK